MLLTAVTFAENPVFAGLRNAQAPAQPMSADTQLRIANAAAEALARYVKPRNGNHLSERNDGASRTWMETKGLKLTRITSMPGTPADAANGITQIYLVAIEGDMYRTFDRNANRWTPWSNGRNPFMPSAITVECRSDGSLNAYSKEFSRLIMFGAHGSPETISKELQPETAPVQFVPLAKTGGKTAPAKDPESPPLSKASASAPGSINSFSFTVLVFLLVVVIVLAKLLPEIMALPSAKGRLGEWQVERALRGLPPGNYHVFHDLYLPRPDGNGTTQVDHVVVCLSGIFVIETKNYQGWIFGGEHQPQWTQQIYRQKNRFQNPLHQNWLHIRALASLLMLPEDRFESVVCFIGNASFKTPMPGNVLNQGLLTWITGYRSPKLLPGEIERACAALQALQQTTDRRLVARKHVEDLRNRASH